MTNWFPTDMDKSIPMYKAIADAIAADVRTGMLNPGDRLPTHRDLADALQVNVSTITRAYKEAMYRGLINGTVGRGTYVSADVRTNLSLASTDTRSGSSLLEMGLVTGLYGLDPVVEKTVSRISKKRDLSAFLRYSPSEGLPEHKAAGAVWAQRYGIKTTSSQVMIFSGVQHGLSCSLLSLFRSGDRVAVEQLTYPGIKTIAAMAGVHLVPVEMDKYGMIPDALDVACRREKIKGVYLVPSVQNPTTVCMPANRREEMAGVITRRNLILLEDDAFALTRPEISTPMASLIPEDTIYFAGVSKILWPGLRVCFAVVPQRFYPLLTDAILNTIWMTPPLNVALISEWIQTDEIHTVIARKREEAIRRNNAANEILKGHTFIGHPAGFFMWLLLESPWTGRTFAEAALKAGVRVFGAEKFMVGGGTPPAAVRVSLTGPESLDGVHKGLSILSHILDDIRSIPEGIL